MTVWSEDRNQPQARVLLDSVSPDGKRLTTIEATLHRFVLAELNTHRVFSRNSASSRAIPVARQLERVRANPATPVIFPAEQKGMQGDETEDLRNKPWAFSTVEDEWRQASEHAAVYAQSLHDAGVHKSVVNRLLEPFMWHTVIITSTEWDGFWKQRCSPDAQPEIRVMAEAMRVAYDASEPTLLEYGDWHTPLIQPDEDDEFWEQEACKRLREVRRPIDALMLFLQCRVSVARCARVSYMTHDGKRDISADLELYERLEMMGHWSPFEHVATPCLSLDGRHNHRLEGFQHVAHLGNFDGWDQLRHQVEGR